MTQRLHRHTIMGFILFAVLLSFAIFAENIGTVVSKLCPSQSVYECLKTDETIRIDE